MTMINRNSIRLMSHGTARLAGALGLGVLLMLFSVGAARFDFKFESVGAGLSYPPVLDSNNTPFDRSDDTLLKPQFQRQAGSHPDFSFAFSVKKDQSGFPLESVRDVDLDLPKGMVGNPTGVAECTPEQLTNQSLGGADCPVASQVGMVELIAWGLGGPGPMRVSLFNMAHGPDVPARFGFNYANVLGLITARVRPGDYGISSGSLAISAAETIESVRVTLWGVPADSSHDVLRQKHIQSLGNGAFGTPSNDYFLQGLISTDVPRLPFLTAPTSCSEDPVSFTARGDSWENPGKFDTLSVSADEDGVPFAFENCERVGFD